MSSFDTKVEGESEQLVSLSTWLSSSLAPAADTAGDQLSTVKKDVGSEWEGQTADAIVSWAERAVTSCDDISSAITTVATAVGTYASVLSWVCREAEGIRQEAAAAELKVSGTTVHKPTDKGDANYETKEQTYNSLSMRMTTANNTLASAQGDLRGSLDDAVAELRLDISVFSAVVDYKVGQTLAEITRKQRASYAAEAAQKQEHASRIREGGKAPGDRLPSWMTKEDFYREQDFAGQLEREAKDKLKKSKTFKSEYSFGAKAVIKGTPAVVGAALGIWADMQDGEDLKQAGVSNFSSTAAAMAVGAAYGSFVPGAGTAVGAVVGFAVATGVSLFTDAAVDSLFEDKKGLWHAGKEGLGAVGDAAKDAAGSVKDSVDAAKDVAGNAVDAAKEQWSKWF